MNEAMNQFEERQPRPIWKEILEIEKKIDKKMKMLGLSFDSSYEEDLKKIREKFGWYEKWAITTKKDRESIAIEYTKKINRLQKILFHILKKSLTEKALIEVEQNYRTALKFFTGGQNSSIDETLQRVKNDTIEDEAKTLEKILSSITTENLKFSEEKILTYIKELKRNIIYRELTEAQKEYIEDLVSAIGITADLKFTDKEQFKNILLGVVEEIVQIIRSKKK